MHSYLYFVLLGIRYFLLNTNFHRDFHQHGWGYAFSKYFLHDQSSRYAKISWFKPSIHSYIIIIPIHISNSHWISLTHCVLGQQTYFLYSNDLNSQNMEESIKTMYSPSFTSSTFHRTGSIWINCTSFTYHPHQMNVILDCYWLPPLWPSILFHRLTFYYLLCIQILCRFVGGG